MMKIKSENNNQNEIKEKQIDLLLYSSNHTSNYMHNFHFLLTQLCENRVSAIR